MVHAMMIGQSIKGVFSNGSSVVAPSAPWQSMIFSGSQLPQNCFLCFSEDNGDTKSIFRKICSCTYSAMQSFPSQTISQSLGLSKGKSKQYVHLFFFMPASDVSHPIQTTHMQKHIRTSHDSVRSEAPTHTINIAVRCRYHNEASVHSWEWDEHWRMHSTDAHISSVE